VEQIAAKSRDVSATDTKICIA